MRIEGMDANTRTAEYAMSERVPAQAQPTETLQKVVVEQKTQYEPEPSPDSNNRLIRMAIDKANKQMLSRETSLQFEPYDKTGDMIVRIIDTKTKEVIREIPSKKILDMVANMLEMAGILVDERR